MTRIYVDCEYNGLGGKLLSMALVTDRNEEWYQVLRAPDLLMCDKWVWEHVMPYLGQPAIGEKSFMASLEAFLKPLDGAEFIADWPADFEHLSACMTHIGAMNGFRMPIECTMRLVHSGELHSVTPHNALSDARALRDWHMGLGKPQELPEPVKTVDLLWW